MHTLLYSHCLATDASAARRPHRDAHGWEVFSAFASAFRAGPRGSRAVVLDVGANSGDWGKWTWIPLVKHASASGKTLEAFMLEPNPFWATRLRDVAAANNATFIPAAAHNADSLSQFHAQGGSVSSQLVRSSNTTQNVSGGLMVRTIDLAALIARILPEEGGLALMKIDVESAEYELLPWLLAHGALCRISHLVIEWHLNRLPVERRFAGLGLRIAFNSLLRHGCAIPPLLVFHDEYAPNNYALPVPGLPELAVEHHKWARKSNHWMAGSEHADSSRMNHDFQVECHAPACGTSRVPPF